MRTAAEPAPRRETRILNRTLSRSLLGGALLVGVLTLGVGCAYYNLFYNAEEALEEAEKLGRDVDPREQPTSQQRTQYQRAIGKAQLLLEEYPESDLVDDALFLIGKCHLRLEEWSDALRSLDNLLVNFPASEFVEEAMYLKGRAHLGRGEEQIGLDWFARLRESFPDGRFAAEALFRLGDAYVEDGRTSRAIEVYGQFLERYPDRADVSGVRVSLARALVEQDRLEEAIDQLELVEPDEMTPGERFEARRLRIETLIAVGRPDEAAELVSLLPGDATDASQRHQARLIEGEVLLELGRVDEGVAVLEELAAAQARTDVAGEAWYIVVEYFALEEGPDSETLAEKLAITADISLGRQYTQIVRARAAQVERHDELVAVATETDSTSADDRAVAALDLGELLLFEFDRAEDALTWYELALELGGDTEVGPRAAYAIGWIHDEILQNPDEAAIAFDRLRERYPESVQARALAGEEFLEPKERTPEQLEALALARIRAAGAGSEGVIGGADPDDPRFAPQRSLQLGGPGAFTPRDREGS